MSNHRKFLGRTTAAAALVALFASPALAQEAPAADEPADEEEIIVTGTQIRGVEAAGSAPQRLDREDIEQSGAFSVRELMATIPQLSTATLAYAPERINSERTPPATFRNLDAFSGTSSTLILIDGGRMAGTGITQSFADPNIIPPSALERVDLITGGGSAIYGADAVGGVINFVTRTDFDGTEIGVRYGFTEDGYSTYSADLAHGWDWDSGSLAVFYSANGNSDLENRDQSNRIYNYAPYGTGGVDRRGLACDPVTVNSGGTFYNSETGTAYAAPPTCNTDSGDAVPEALRHSLFAGLRQDLASGVELQVRAYIATGDTDNDLAPTVYNPSVTNAAAPDPAFGGGALATPYTPYFSFDGVRRDSNTTEQLNYGFRPTLSIDLAGDWQVRTSINYSRSEYTYDDVRAPTVTDIAAAVNGTLPGLAGQFLNPFNLAASDPAVLAELWDETERFHTEQELASIGAVFDGPLFTMPSGDAARLAIGGEMSSMSFDGTRLLGDAGAAPTIDTVADAHRSIDSMFAELNLPLASPENNIPLVYSIDLSLAVRYDDYSDFGDTTNPMVGVVWRPVESLALRGKWGTSFAAPSLTDTSGALDTSVNLVASGIPFISAAVLGIFLPGDAQGLATIAAYGAPFDPPTIPFPLYAPPIIQLLGGGQALRPEESESYEVGFDWDVPLVDGLRVSATYWDLVFENRINALDVRRFFRAEEGTLFLANEVGDGLTQAQMEAYLASIGVTATTPHLGFGGVGTDLDALYAAYPGSILAPLAPAGPSLIADTRRTNQGAVHLWGIDASASYTHAFDWGVVFGEFNAAQTLGHERSITGGGWADDTQQVNSNYGDFRFTLSGGFTTGPWTARATLNYLPGYSLTDPVANALGYDEVESFTPIDVFTSYTFDQPDGLLNGVELSLAVDNVFNEEPSFRLNSENGGLGNTLGRLMSVGVRKRF